MADRLALSAETLAVVLPFGWRIVPAREGTAVWNEKFEAGTSQLCGNRREFPGCTAHCRSADVDDADHAAVSRLKHSASPGRAVSATAPIRVSAQWSGRLTTWAIPASTGIRMLMGAAGYQAVGSRD